MALPTSLSLVGPVHVGGVQEGNAELDGAMDRSYRLVLVCSTVELTHAHASQTQLRDHKPLSTQTTFLHTLLLFRCAHHNYVNRKGTHVGKLEIVLVFDEEEQPA